MGMNRTIFNMFRPSPIRPLQDHIAKALECAQMLVPFFEMVLHDDWEAVHQYQENIAALERVADKLKRELFLNLPKGLFLPVDRSDVLEIATHQDRIANRARDIAGLVMGRRMSIPAVIAPFFMAFLKRSIDATVQAKKIIDELDELLETGFRGDEADLVRKMVMTLDEIEHDTDEMQIEVRGELFRIETQLPPIDVVFLYKIIDRTGDLADQAQIVGGQLLLLLAR